MDLSWPGKLIARYITHPLTPLLGMRFGYEGYAIGLGDLLLYSLFFVAAYKAYGARAAAIAAGVIFVMGGPATACTGARVHLSARPRHALGGQESQGARSSGMRAAIRESKEPERRNKQV